MAGAPQDLCEGEMILIITIYIASVAFNFWSLLGSQERPLTRGSFVFVTAFSLPGPFTLLFGIVFLTEGRLKNWLEKPLFKSKEKS